MHATDHGLFKRLLELVDEWVHSSRQVALFESAWLLLGLFPQLRVFQDGVLSLPTITAREHRAIAINLPFVLQRLTGSTTPLLAALAYARWRKQLNLFEYCARDLAELDVLGRRFQETLNDLSVLVTSSKVHSTIKFHKINHWSKSICEFGIPDNFNAETFETAHRFFVKTSVGKLQRCPEKTIMQRERVSILHNSSTDLPVFGAPKGSLRNLTKQQQQKTLFSLGRHQSRISHVVGSRDWTFHQKLFLNHDDGWVREGHAISLFLEEQLCIVLVYGFVTRELGLWIVCSCFDLSHSSSPIAKVCSPLRLRNEVVVARFQLTNFVCFRHVQPNFSESSRTNSSWFLNTLLF